MRTLLKTCYPWLVVSLASLALLSCASTGNPYEDSLFFSPKLADQRHDRMRKDLRDIESDTEEARISAISKKGTLSRLNNENRSRQNEIARIKAKTRSLEQQKVALSDEIESARKEGRDDSELLKQRSDIEAEIDGLNRTLQKLIQIQ